MNGSSYGDSNLKYRIFLLGSGLVFGINVIGLVLLSQSFLFKQPTIEISQVGYYLILTIAAILLGGLFILITRPLLDHAFLLLTSKNLGVSDMTSKSCESDLEFQQKSIGALLSISESDGNLLPLEKVFHHALRVVQEVTGFNTVVIRLYDEKEKCLRLAAQQGMSSSMQTELLVVPINNPIVSEAFRSFWPVPIEDLTTADEALVGASPISSGFRSVVCIPLVSGEVPIGTMDLGAKEPHHWSQDELRWLALVGRTIGSIVHRVRLTEHLRDFAALQERSRIAQELHDGLVQLIGSINLWSQEAQEAMNAEDYPATQDALSRIKTFSSDAYANLREELLGLRDKFDSDRDLLCVIGDYLNRYQRQWGIDTQLSIDESTGLNISSIISPPAEIQLLRVIQEALTNVRRHAQATKVTINVSKDDNYLNIKIKDNGLGFKVTEVESNHLGLNIMRERVGIVDGIFQLVSEPGSGTEIFVKIPRQKTGIVHRSIE